VHNCSDELTVVGLKKKKSINVFDQIDMTLELKNNVEKEEGGGGI